MLAKRKATARHMLSVGVTGKPLEGKDSLAQNAILASKWERQEFPYLAQEWDVLYQQWMVTFGW